MILSSLGESKLSGVRSAPHMHMTCGHHRLEHFALHYHLTYDELSITAACNGNFTPHNHRLLCI